jgi:hypothetical protein
MPASKRKVAVRDASAPEKCAKCTLSCTRSARYHQRSSLVQSELDTASRLFRRQLAYARAGKTPTLTPAGKAATTPPRRWCLVASLFGGAACHPMYVLGALKLASHLPIPWSLWLAIDESTSAAWSHLLAAAPNIHLVVVGRSEQQPGQRRRARGKWAVNMFTRYLLLDDAVIAGAYVIDLDVHGQAAGSALKMWRAADAAKSDEHKTAFGVVSYPVGSRGMAGRNTTWNGGAVAVAKRQPEALGFADSIKEWIGDHAETCEYGCDETWLGSASPIYTAYQRDATAVLDVMDTADIHPVIPGVSRRPQSSAFAVHDVAITQVPSKEACMKDLEALAAEGPKHPDFTHLRSVHDLLSSRSPSSNALVADWVCDGRGRYGDMV